MHRYSSCFTGCKDGQYGRDCQLNCSGNCLNKEICDKQNGACESCAEGYQGGKCDESMLFSQINDCKWTLFFQKVHN